MNLSVYCVPNRVARLEMIDPNVLMRYLLEQARYQPSLPQTLILGTSRVEGVGFRGVGVETAPLSCGPAMYRDTSLIRKCPPPDYHKDLI